MKTPLLLFLISLLFPLGLNAAEENPEAENPDLQTEQAGQAEDIAPLDGTQAGGEESLDEGAEGPLDENFVPTVRITEDLPVAFPVDI